MGIMIHGRCNVCDRPASNILPGDQIHTAPLYCSDECRNKQKIIYRLTHRITMKRILLWFWYFIFPARAIKVLPAKTEDSEPDELLVKFENFSESMKNVEPIIPMPDFKQIFYEVVKENEDEVQQAEREGFLDPEFKSFCKFAFKRMIDRTNGVSSYDFFMDHDYKGNGKRFRMFCHCLNKVCKDIGLVTTYKGDNTFHFEPSSVRKLMATIPTFDDNVRGLLTQGPYR